jgi:hypothetical protein
LHGAELPRHGGRDLALSQAEAMSYPSDEQCREKIKQLKKGDTLTVVVSHRRSYGGTHWHDIDIRCNRPAWKSWSVRSGKTCNWFIGSAKTCEAAEKRGNTLIKKLQKLRDE